MTILLHKLKRKHVCGLILCLHSAPAKFNKMPPIYILRKFNLSLHHSFDNNFVTLPNKQKHGHLGNLKRATGKPCYCLFVAPTINEACIAHFFGLSQLNIIFYGGKSVIVPLSRKVFRKMVEDMPPLTLATIALATIKSSNCDRFYLGFIRFSLIPYLLIASVSKPRKTF